MAHPRRNNSIIQSFTSLFVIFLVDSFLLRFDFQVVIPKMVSLLDKQINKQLTFRYDIAKGYVQGEEDISCLIAQIAAHDRIYQVSKITVYYKEKNNNYLGQYSLFILVKMSRTWAKTMAQMCDAGSAV